MSRSSVTITNHALRTLISPQKMHSHFHASLYRVFAAAACLTRTPHSDHSTTRRAAAACPIKMNSNDYSVHWMMIYNCCSHCSWDDSSMAMALDDAFELVKWRAAD